MTRAGCLAEDETRVGFVDVDSGCFMVSGRDGFGQGCRVGGGGQGWRQKPGLGVTCVKREPRALELCLHKARAGDQIQR